MNFAGDEKLAKILIEHGANVNSKANDGTTPLHQASWPTFGYYS